MKLFYLLIVTWALLSGCHDRGREDSQGEQSIYRDGSRLWMSDLDKALAKAKRHGKPLLIMISEPSCRWCIKVKKGPLSDPRVHEALRPYILVKLRRSDHAQSGRIKAFDGKIPSFFVLTPEGEVIDSIVGYYQTEDFLHYLQEISGEME